MIVLSDKFEEISFENLVWYHRNELLETYYSEYFPKDMSSYTRQRLRDYGVFRVEKGQLKDRVYLTEKTIRVLRKNQII